MGRAYRRGPFPSMRARAETGRPVCYTFPMQVTLFGRTVVMRWRTLLLWSLLGLFLAFVVLFGYSFTRSFLAIRRSGGSAWLEQRLESSVARAVANTRVTPEDLKALDRPGRPSLGPQQAKLTVVAFIDYGCPFCRRAAGPFREAMLKYQDRVRFVVRDFPVEELHPNAIQAAQAVRCAFAQNKGWAMHDLLFTQTGDLVPADFERFAAQAGVDLTQYRRCVEAQTFSAQIQEDLADGSRAGVQGTPTYFFNGVRIQGVPQERPEAYFEFLIERFLQEAAASSTVPTP